MGKRRGARACLLMGCLALAATTGCVGQDDEVGTARQPIVNGEAPNAPEHDAVVSLHEIAGKGVVFLGAFCSGTLIAANVVLTAAHCVEHERPGSFIVYVGDEPAAFASDGRRDLLHHDHAVAEVLVHPGFNRFSLQNDIALVRTADDVAAAEGVAPVPNLPASMALGAGDIGDPINFCGFGRDENGDGGVKLQVDLPLGGLGCPPGVGGCNAASQFFYDQATGGPCFGDSGGPGFYVTSGATYTAGATSFVTSGDCDGFGVSTAVSAYQAFIDAFVGVGCDLDDVCGAGESCDGRDGTTACADCAGKPHGKPSTRFCYVEGVCEGPGCPP